MATKEEIIALVRHHFAGNEEQFRNMVEAIAAGSKEKGQHQVADQLNRLLESDRRWRNKNNASNTMTPLPLDSGNEQFIHARPARARLSDLMLDDKRKSKVELIIAEQRASDQLFDFALAPTRKIMLLGRSGTGKTMTAEVLASELEMPFFVVRLDAVIASYLGQTQKNLRHVFNAIGQRRGVYLFDEFDALAASRDRDGDVGEMRRSVNALLMMLDEDGSRSIIVGTSNLGHMIDPAMRRRFDMVIHYDSPSVAEARALIAATLGPMPCDGFTVEDVSNNTLRESIATRSHAEIVAACRVAMRGAILRGKKSLSLDELTRALSEPQNT